MTLFTAVPPRLTFFMGLALTLGLSACASTPTADNPETFAAEETQTSAPLITTEATETAPETPAETADIKYGNFTREQLTQAILGELGGLRGDLPMAAHSYQELAHATRDIGIIQRAIQFAVASEDSDKVMEMARLWITLAPDDIDPYLLLAYRYVELGQFEPALESLAKVLELGGNVNFTDISGRTQDLPQTQRLAIQQQLDRLHQLFPEEQSLHFALVQVMAQNGQITAALQQLQQLRAENGDSVRLILIEAQLLQGVNRQQEANELLARGINNFPDSRLLRMNYAQSLIQLDRLDEALAQYLLLTERAPEDHENRLALALLHMELEQRQEAREHFEYLLRAGYRSNDVHLYLGYLFQAEGELEASIRQFSQVQMESNNFLNAQQQIILMLVNRGSYADAHEWTSRVSANNPRLESILRRVEMEALVNHGATTLAKDVIDGAISKYPRDTDLLFSRTLLYERNGEMAAAEQDLKHIITLEPDNARALNHLGYTLADRTDRFQEALELIERAIALEPDDPAIIDSLGWVQFKLGRLEEARENLERAYAVFPDHEVAAHLGEVLWVMGQISEARQVWEEALENRPDSELLRAVMQRLDINS
ncbi:MAG: tetratricopeptide repeat protein [Pseudomonadales bacterium]|nr:tetratricopeptide repeat protein [Pseudomonadales bacterium]